MNTDKTIAIIGASANRYKYGNIAVRAYKDQGYTVYPINLREEIIEGLPCYQSILDVPGSVELVSIYLHPEETLTILDDLPGKGVKTVFLNPGSANDTVVQRAQELGLDIIQACSIIAAGKSPAQY